MNTEKSGNLQKLIAVVLIALIALFLIGATAVTGLGNNKNDLENGNENSANNNQNISGEGSNDNTNGAVNDNTSQTPTNTPKYISKLTGLEITEEEYLSISYAVMIEPSSMLYGISTADLCIEIPLEGGKTRYLVYLQNTENMGKIGNIAPSRAFISDLSKYFGGVVLANGNDSKVDYGQKETNIHLNLSENENYFYTENIDNVYTSGKLIAEFTSSMGIDNLSVKKPTLPFKFSESNVTGSTSAYVVNLPYSKDTKTTFVFDEAVAKYKVIFNDKEQIDMLGGASSAYTNVFVLFADSTTYEKSTGIEAVTDTLGGGSGYYVSHGKLTEIKWSINSLGNLEFHNLSGNTLEVNVGNSYIGYFKASEAKSVTFE